MSEKYDVLAVDPPWPVRRVFRASKNPRPITNPYNVATLPDVWTLLDTEVFPYGETPHALFLWTLEQYLDDAEAFLAKRGYKRHHRLIWSKNVGTYLNTVQRTHEYLLWYCKPKFLPIERSQRGRYGTVFTAPVRAMVGTHARKPSIAYKMIEDLYPYCRRLEVFAREYRVGWSGMGAERDRFTPLLAPLRDVGMVPIL